MNEISSFLEDQAEIQEDLNAINEKLAFFYDKYDLVPLISNVIENNEPIEPCLILNGYKL